MVPSRPKVFEFTLPELVIFAVFLVMLAGFLIPVVSGTYYPTRILAAKDAMHAIEHAMANYREDFQNYYPPDNKFGLGTTDSLAGSRALAYFLTTRFKIGELHYGPYLDVPSARLNGTPPALVSPLKNHQYLYANIYDADGVPRYYLIVDSGPDGKFGGAIDTHPAVGASLWQSDGSGGDTDNIFSTIVK